MLKEKNNQKRPQLTKFSFGATSAIITNLCLIVGLDTFAYAKASIIGGILVIALADNISDSVGIHIYQESECVNTRDVWFSTLSNFATRLLVSFSFILLVAMLPMKVAMAFSIIWGFLLLGFMSYTIAKNEGVNPAAAITEHFSIAITAVVLSEIVGRWLISKIH